MALVVYSVSVFAVTPFQQQSYDDVIKRFTERETEAKQARNRYTYLEDMVIQPVTSFGFSEGRYRRSCSVSYVNGERRESFLDEKNEMKGPRVTPADLRDLAYIYQFFLTEKDLPDYKLKFLKTEKVDDLNTYVFEVRPAKTPDPRKSTDRVFTGQIWIDDKDYQIVKIAGHSEPEFNGNRSARFETYYTFVADKYWFPWQTISGDVLATGRANKLTLKVVYSQYKPAK